MRNDNGKQGGVEIRAEISEALKPPVSAAIPVSLLKK